MPLPRQPVDGQTFEEMMGLTPGPGQVPSSAMFNDYIAQRPLTREQQNEQGTINAMDARTDASFANDLNQSRAIANARNQGFESPRAQEEHMFQRGVKGQIDIAHASSENALMRMLLSNQLISQRQSTNADRVDDRQIAGREGTAERTSNNQLRADNLARANKIETPRSSGGYALPDENVKWYNKGLPNTISQFFGADTEQQIRTRDANKLRDQIPNPAVQPPNTAPEPTTSEIPLGTQRRTRDGRLAIYDGQVWRAK